MEEVKNVMSKLVDKTPINDKLLSRPPFRYLYDMIIELNQKFNCFQLPSIDPDIVTKEQKLSFLQSVIEQVGPGVNAKASKIVAGLEVENTWELLILISKKINEKVLIDKELEKQQKKQEKSKIPEKNVEKSRTSLAGPVQDKPMKKSGSKEKKERIEPKEMKSPYTKTAEKPEPSKKPVSKSKEESRRETQPLGEKNLKVGLKSSAPKEKPATSIKKTSSKELKSPEQPVASSSPKKKKLSKNESEENLQHPITRKKSEEFSKTNVLQTVINATNIAVENKAQSFIDSSNVSPVSILKDENQEHPDLNYLMEMTSNRSTKKEDMPTAIVQSKLLKSIASTGYKNETDNLKFSPKSLTESTIQDFIQSISKNIHPLSDIIEYLPENVEAMSRENLSWDPLIEKYKMEYLDEKQETMKLTRSSTREQNELNLRIRKAREMVKVAYYNLHHTEDIEQKIMNSIVNPD